MSHLNHLQVVANTASAGVNAASSLLSKGKDYVPKSAAPVVAALEERASPLLAFAADTAGGALVSVDKKVGPGTWGSAHRARALAPRAGRARRPTAPPTPPGDGRRRRRVQAVRVVVQGARGAGARRRAGGWRAFGVDSGGVGGGPTPAALHNRARSACARDGGAGGPLRPLLARGTLRAAMGAPRAAARPPSPSSRPTERVREPQCPRLVAAEGARGRLAARRAPLRPGAPSYPPPPLPRRSPSKRRSTKPTWRTTSRPAR